MTPSPTNLPSTRDLESTGGIPLRLVGWVRAHPDEFGVDDPDKFETGFALEQLVGDDYNMIAAMPLIWEANENNSDYYISDDQDLLSRNRLQLRLRWEQKVLRAYPEVVVAIEEMLSVLSQKKFVDKHEFKFIMEEHAAFVANVWLQIRQAPKLENALEYARIVQLKPQFKKANRTRLSSLSIFTF